ncbi:hypothetical protein SAMN05421788_10398 [Filimonas lacunae]|uniref:DUF5675 domain-containing protein n=1 Tax=Filimonas lacunae TaxID=477680 RepID=A0A173MK24_9BACT|nr:DUF5675 family protein [Filimonas lacunae]BAV07748.1 hypothetical protein FLA_3779 [Filimonas lacunae]SIT04338.1 hypothetical protein SAMN05421788_10398 [Filimonas lacunae]
MELLLTRRYHHKGTNGQLAVNGKLFCFTIELPWLQNQRHISCIPEGSYQLAKRHSEDRGYHLILRAVPDRSLILIHPANNALQELQGCISPVSSLTAPGCGNSSRAVFEPLVKLVYAALDKKEEVRLRIISEE